MLLGGRLRRWLLVLVVVGVLLLRLCIHHRVQVVRLALPAQLGLLRPRLLGLGLELESG